MSKKEREEAEKQFKEITGMTPSKWGKFELPVILTVALTSRNSTMIRNIARDLKVKESDLVNAAVAEIQYHTSDEQTNRMIIRWRDSDKWR